MAKDPPIIIGPPIIIDPPEPEKGETFGEHLVTLRKEAGLSIDEAASACGLLASQWEQMEANASHPRARLLRIMGNALGVKPYEVL